MTATASQALEEWVLFSWQMCTDVCSMQWTGDGSILEEVKIQTLSLPYLPIESDFVDKMTPLHIRNAGMTF